MSFSAAVQDAVFSAAVHGAVLAGSRRHSHSSSQYVAAVEKYSSSQYVAAVEKYSSSQYVAAAEKYLYSRGTSHSVYLVRSFA